MYRDEKVKSITFFENNIHHLPLHNPLTFKHEALCLNEAKSNGTSTQIGYVLLSYC